MSHQIENQQVLQPIRSWSDIPTLSPEMKEEIRIRYRDSLREKMNGYGGICKMLCRPVSGSWSDPTRREWLRNSGSRMHPAILTTLCNKTTAMYSYENDEDGGDRIMSGCFADEWFAHHKGRPNIQFGRFFCNWVPIHSEGPKSITEIVRAHTSTCDEAVSLLKAIQDGREKAGPQVRGSTEFQKCPEQYAINPLYRSIFIIRGEFTNPGDAHSLWESYTGCAKSLDLTTWNEAQNVLLVRTGHEAGLSAPIDFENLRDKCLPLCRPDVNTPNAAEWIVRVSLATAFKFIADLEQREYTAFPTQRVMATDDHFKWAEEYNETETSDTWEKALEKYETRPLPETLNDITQEVMDDLPYVRNRGYSPADPRWTVRCFQYQRWLREDSKTDYYEVFKMYKRKCGDPLGLKKPCLI